ncbi:MAG: succinate dehydrogenase, cytochrome b556 subunit [Pseudomonadota bacterium]|nr:succinate dehydrogenase, cytochrome b556 subunit [Pseudomonadota bacterium]
MSDIDRPLSPHLQVYSWRISNTTSILHRLTGVGLSLGVFCFVGWVVSIAFGPAVYAMALSVLSGPLGLVILFLFSLSFFYHLSNGIRHLFWDIGYGFEKGFANKTGWFAIFSALFITVLFWFGVMK